jgi:hypothetical protein
MRRLRLLQAEIAQLETGKQEAIVKLRFINRDFIGATFFEPGEQAECEATAHATIQAIKYALPIPVNLCLEKVIKMRPEFLNDVLLVVMIGLQLETKRLSLTGCCVCLEQDIPYGVARATLDSTNRVVDYILNKY